MKAKINGIEVECTPEEFKALTSKQEVIEPIKREVIEAPKDKPIRKWWTKEESKYLVELNSKGTPIEEICRLLNRNKNSINIQLLRLKKETPKKGYDKTAQRMKYIHARVKQLTAQYGYSYERAFRFASDEYNAKNGQLHIPKLVGIDDEKVLLDLVKHCIESKQPITLSAVRAISSKINKDNWLDFTFSFFNHAPQIARVLGIEDKFKIVNGQILYQGGINDGTLEQK